MNLIYIKYLAYINKYIKICNISMILCTFICKIYSCYQQLTNIVVNLRQFNSLQKTYSSRSNKSGLPSWCSMSVQFFSLHELYNCCCGIFSSVPTLIYSKRNACHSKNDCISEANLKSPNQYNFQYQGRVELLLTEKKINKYSSWTICHLVWTEFSLMVTQEFEEILCKF